MAGPNLWAKHYQSIWLERSVDPCLETWLRCAALAFGLHAANGHAPLASGELAVVLGKPGAPLDRRNIPRFIKQAVRRGWLSPASCARCLVVPPHAVSGPSGDPFAPCRVRHPAPMSSPRDDQVITE